MGYRKDALSSCGLGYRKDALSSCGLGYRKDALSTLHSLLIGAIPFSSATDTATFYSSAGGRKIQPRFAGNKNVSTKGAFSTKLGAVATTGGEPAAPAGAPAPGPACAGAVLPRGPYGCGAGRRAAFPGSKTTLTGISNQYRTAACQCNRGLLPCQCTSRAQTNQSKRRYRSAKRRCPYMFLNVDIEDSSISNHSTSK